VADYPALDLRFPPGPGAGALQDLLYAELDAFEPLAIQEHEAGDGWLVFFRIAAHRDAARDSLRFALGANVLDITSVDVPDEDWARRSQAGLTAVRVGRVVVAPPWDVPSADPSAITIVIDPSMGFGTGHHATTRLCLELLQTTGLSGKRMIDVGTGSGVLAIAAAMLGATSVLAIDNDPDALQSARENVAANGRADVEVVEADLSALSAGAADVVTANLTAAVLRKHSPALAALVASGGSLIVSGFGPSELADVCAHFDARIDRTVQESDWAAARVIRG
jgi:ribosomal protein L11 methyltransferase